jgi:hypothetical protein
MKMAASLPMRPFYLTRLSSHTAWKGGTLSFWSVAQWARAKLTEDSPCRRKRYADPVARAIKVNKEFKLPLAV